jgi:NAD-dependent deacetylase
MSASDLGEDFLDCTCCAEPQRVRPDIVWFGEMPMHMNEIYGAVEACEVFIVVGSSGHVYPAADLVHIAQANGARTILVNAEPPLNVDFFDEIHLGKAGELLPVLVQGWLGPPA